MDFDHLLTHVGEFGKYQKLLFLFQAPFAVFLAFVLFGQIFMTIYPPVRSAGRPKPCGQRWSHNTSEWNFVTVVTEAGYWCDTLPSLDIDWKVTITQSVFYVGAIVGGILIGYIADQYGRVPALVAANACGCVGGVLSVVTTNFWFYCFFRFITGLSFDNCFTMIYILVLEYVGPSYRTLVANLSIALFYTFGSVIIPGLFQLIRNWRWFGLVISLPMLLSLLALCIVPESARWLLSKGRTKDATNILRDIARKNGKFVEDEVFIEFQRAAEEAYEQIRNEEQISLLDALKRPKIFKNFLLLVMIWALVALIYDGHSRNVLNLGSNIFTIFAIASRLELPADLVVVFILDVAGRRWLAFAALTSAATFSLISAAPQITGDPTILLIFALLSRFFVNVAFNIGLQYAAEILPTVVRAQGVNFIHIMGYVFAILSPFIASIGRTNPSLSLTILGLCALVSGILCLFLPETLGEELPNSLEDGEHFGSKQSFWNCPVCSKREPKMEEEKPPKDAEGDRVYHRNSLRASIRGETLRSSIIYRSTSPLKRKRLESSAMESVRIRRSAHARASFPSLQ